MEDRTEHWTAAPGLEAWLAQVSAVPDGAWEPMRRAMDPWRQARCARYRREEDRRRCILADALARRALSALTGADPAAIRLEREPSGRLLAPGLGVRFSLSHSGDLVLCAAAPFPVGADVQRFRSLSPALERLARRAGCPPGDPAAFFRWWTRREAAGKLTGAGLSPAPLPEGLRFWDRDLRHGGERYALSLCARGEELSPPALESLPESW